jgi:hypothetical protein
MAESHGGLEAIAVIPSTVEEQLRRTMVLGLPQDDAEKPTFFFEKVVSWAEQDSEGRPWDWTTAPDSETQKASVKPICAYEFTAPLGRSGAQFSEVGDFFVSTVIITITETDLPDILDSSHVVIGPGSTRWWFRYFHPALGLGGLTVYQAHFQAEDTE